MKNKEKQRQKNLEGPPVLNMGLPEKMARMRAEREKREQIAQKILNKPTKR